MTLTPKQLAMAERMRDGEPVYKTIGEWPEWCRFVQGEDVVSDLDLQVLILKEIATFDIDGPGVYFITPAGRKALEEK